MVSKASNASQASKADREHNGTAPSAKPAGEQSQEKEKKDSGGVKGAVKRGGAFVAAGKALAAGTKIAAVAQKAMAYLSALSVFAKIAVAFVMGLLTLMLGASFLLSGTVARKDDVRKDCFVYVDRAAIGTSDIPYNAEEAVLRNKKRIYSVLFYYGLRPEQCFAVLGNWSVESGLDPTAVETVSTEPFRLGKWKQSAVALDFSPMFRGQAMYDSYFKDKPIKRVGIGLGQWTNERNENLLRYASRAGRDQKGLDDGSKFEWYDLDVQLAYMLDTSSVGDSGAGWIKDFSKIGRVTSEKQERSDPDSIEFRGDLPVETVYGAVDCIGDGVADSYYDGTLPKSEATCRDDAKEQAERYCNWKQNSGLYNLTNSAGEYIGVDEEAYKNDFGRVYRFRLYENMVKKYTYDFMTGWEGIDNDTYDARLDYALSMFYDWYGSSTNEEAAENPGDPNVGSVSADFFKVEEGYGYSVLSVLEKTKNVSNALSKVYTTDDDMKNCTRIIRVEDDYSLARTAVTLAWPTRDASVGNNGTRMYQYIHDCVIPGDDIYQSCDRTVCTIVRWSGYDDQFPPGATLNVMAYLVASPRWAQLDWDGDPDQLEPGDILIRKDSVAQGSDAEVEDDTHHVLMYVGSSAVFAYWKEGKNDTERLAGPPVASSNKHYVVHGSYGERSPGIDTWHDSFSEFHVFRCIHRQAKGTSKYASYGYDQSTDPGAG